MYTQKTYWIVKDHAQMSQRRNERRSITLVAQVFKFGAVVVFIHDLDVELADAYEGVCCLVGGRHRYCKLSLPLAIKLDCGYDNTCNGDCVYQVLNNI